jgi:ABC-type multidrug transport system fused ATPase/permease subunit
MINNYYGDEKIPEIDEKNLQESMFNFLEAMHNHKLLEEEDYEYFLQERVMDHVKTVDKRVSDKVDNKTKDLVEAIKEFTVGQSKEEILENRTKISTLIKRAIIFIATWSIPVIGPVTALIGSVTLFLIRNKIKDDIKKKFLFDLKTELEIVEEKIRDTNSSKDNVKKYQLIRLKNEINKNIEKLRFSID